MVVIITRRTRSSYGPGVEDADGHRHWQAPVIELTRVSLGAIR
jgi:hypothetical protein